MFEKLRYNKYRFQREHFYELTAIQKATGLMVPGRSMTLPGTILENLLSREWGRQLERSFQIPAEHLTAAL